MKTIVLTGGGTGGHVYPALALLDDLEKEFKIEYIGSNGMEKNILKDYPNIPYHEIEAVKLQRKLTPKNLLIPFKLYSSVKSAKLILKQIKPDVIFSKGGYVAVPVCMAAKKLRIPIVSHESDLTFGLANKIILHYCKHMCTNFYETSKKTKKGIYTGAPIRKQIFNGSKFSAKNEMNFYDNKPIVLILGGSLGAQRINKFIIENIDALIEKYNLVHITGPGNSTGIKKVGYTEKEFAKNIENYYALADIVIARAGAGVIFELLKLQKPMLLIPLSKKCSRGDQLENAALFHKLGYAKTMDEDKLSINEMLSNLEDLLKNKEKYKKNMQKASNLDSNKEIVKVILSVTNS